MQVRDENSIAKQRFDNFRLGGGRPASTSGRHAHKRSHSRNTSISSSVSAISLTSATNPQSQPMPSHDLPSSSSNKRNSHHRRRSSMSTRHESAEMMGVPAPDLALSSSSDNINLGEKDSIRRRALLALEGKTDHSFTKVEIPELTTPVLENKSFDFGRQNTFLAPNATPSFGPSLGNSSKRDSFKMLAASSSSKDQLGTLVEEEEEEEESEDTVIKSQQTPVKELVSSPESVETKPRIRPSGLNLRPLSLTAKVTTVGGLPTPVLTPSPRSGLRSLALSHSPTDSEDSLTSFSFRPSTSTPHVPLRHSSLSSNSDSEDSRPSRRSSIGYKSSSNGLITPSMTPTSEHHRFSAGNSIDEQHFHRPLSTSEQHFLFKQHNALLTRITDLERALSSRSMSRPQSCASDLTSFGEADSSIEPTDEMLQLVADLKVERDELSRDVEGWRTRVAGLEKQSSLLAQRLDAERREAWVARSRLGLLEVEKSALERSCDAQTKYANEFQRQYQQLQRDVQDMKETLKQVSGERDTQAIVFKAEISRLTSALSEEQLKLVALEEELSVAKASIIDLTSNQRHNHHAVALESCSTIAEEHQKGVFGGYQPFMSGEDDEDDEEEDPLAKYEDEDELDATIQSSSSFGSDDFQFPRKSTHLPSLSRSLSGSPVEDLPTPLSFPAPLPAPTGPKHAPRASLSKVWTFPKMMAAAPARPVPEDDVDHFFGCLEDGGSNPSSPTMPSVPSYETSKGLFAQGFKVPSQYFMESEDEEDEADPPFMLPNGVGVTSSTDPVDPYDTDEDAVLGEVGGIMITVTPCDTEEDISTLAAQPEPVTDDSTVVPPQIVVDDDDSPRAPSPEITVTPSSPVAEVPVRSPSPSSIPRRVKAGVSSSPPTSRISPSSIPRAVPSKPIFIASPDPSKSSPPRASQDAANQSMYSTPPAKRLNAQAAPWLPAPSTPSKSPAKPSNRQLPPRKAPLLPSNGRSAFFTNTTNDLTREMTGTSYRSGQNQPQYPSSAVMSSIDWTQSSPLPPTLPSPTTSASSLSLYSSAFSSLSSISTFLPLSWPASPDLRANETAPTIAVDNALQASGPKYVGRERQLEKLRLRMMKDGSSICSMDSCKDCDGKTVFL